ncbi:microfibril-associated glycoprotein 4-like [Amphiura filiformis]|uniref:microfibril-associated glycoprotein 4-like n=1 Tax=Amphiura filiformis TaxID=82378 RepID=UPI003B212F0A
MTTSAEPTTNVLSTSVTSAGTTTPSDGFTTGTTGVTSLKPGGTAQTNNAMTTSGIRTSSSIGTAQGGGTNVPDVTTSSEGVFSSTLGHDMTTTASGVTSSSGVTLSNGVTVTASTASTTTDVPSSVTVTPLIFQGCSEALSQGYIVSGIYRLNLLPSVSNYWCDMVSDGGGWMVFQRRLYGSVNFNRTWQEYANGFGTPEGDWWLGNDALANITNAFNFELRVDLSDWEGNDVHVTYKSFKTTGPKYTMSLGQYSIPKSTTGDSLGYADTRDFSTFDMDNDNSINNCMEKYGGGWWANNCFNCNLNGNYHNSSDLPDSKGIVWASWKDINYALKKTEMKIRMTS